MEDAFPDEKSYDGNVEKKNSLQPSYDDIAEVDSLLQNGIFVETDGGLICMSVNDASCSSNFNLSADELQDIAAKLLSLNNKTSASVTGTATDSSSTEPLSKKAINSDSDGFSSECSDVCNVPLSYETMVPPSISLKPLPNMARTRTTALTNSASCSEVSAGSNVSDSDGTGTVVNPIAHESPTLSLPDPKCALDVHKPPKRNRGGWPKGRKRKPELSNLPPKAPATGYNLYLNDQRKFFRGSCLVVHEITKIIGNKWSNLSLKEKQPYLDRAEDDKKRYRDELKTYRQSHAYRAYLAKKRQKRLQNNIFSESDMDATDEIDDEDNEELYCRTCDQWFHNRHNKQEHLQGRQHTKMVAGDIRRELESDSDQCGAISVLSFSTSLDDSSLDCVPNLAAGKPADKTSSSVADSITNLIATVTKRERRIKFLRNRLREAEQSHEALSRQFSLLKDRCSKLTSDLGFLQRQEETFQGSIFNLWKVPSLFLVTDFNDLNDCDIL